MVSAGLFHLDLRVLGWTLMRLAEFCWAQLGEAGVGLLGWALFFWLGWLRFA